MATSPERSARRHDDDTDAENSAPSTKARSEAKPAVEARKDEHEPQAMGALVWQRSKEKPPTESKDAAVDTNKPADADTEHVIDITGPEKPDATLSPEDLAAAEEIGTLSPDEVREVALDGIANRKEALGADQPDATEQTAAESAAAVAAGDFLDATKQRLESDATLSVEEAADQAYQDTVKKHGLGEVVDTAEQAPKSGDADGMNYEDPNAQAGQPFGAARAFAPGGGGRMNPPGPNAQFAAYNAMPPIGGANVPLWTRYTANPNVAPRRDEGAESRAFVLGLLVGGIVGNLLGRRSGRIKAERQFKPVREHLEKQVKGVYETLAFSEEKIRKLTYAHEAVKREQRAAEADAIRARAAERQTQQHLERAQAAPTAGRPEAAISARETTPARAPESVPAVTVDAEKMTMQELLETSEAIKVANMNVREIHENGLITERALRRVVNEFLRGGNFLPVLAAEMDAHARDHELDRQLRNRAPDVDGHTPTGAYPLADSNPLATMADQSQIPRPITPPARSPHAARESAQQMLVRANIAAAVTLGVLLAVAAVVWV
jgi:hypothetical protein